MSTCRLCGHLKASHNPATGICTAVLDNGSQCPCGSHPEPIITPAKTGYAVVRTIGTQIRSAGEVSLDRAEVQEHCDYLNAKTVLPEKWVVATVLWNEAS